ncbi:hypothetical protein JW935_12585 [candidate division KSB1 bacterium]|nr:hypothetical protein [candidate division KSB1 bacterium]
MEDQTNYRLSCSVSEGIVEIVITGELTKDTIDNLHVDVIEIIRGKNAKAVLCDVRNLKGPQEIVAAYFRARSLPTDVKILPSAIVERPGNWDFKSFYETTSANVGHIMKWFTDIESARAWLKGKLT